MYKKGKGALKEYGNEVQKNMEYKKYWISTRNDTKYGRSSRQNTEKKIRKRVSEEGEWTSIESAWMDEELRESIKKGETSIERKESVKTQ